MTRKRLNTAEEALHRSLDTPKTADRRPPSSAVTAKPSKYTLLLDPDSAKLYDQIASAGYDVIGRKVTKSAILRAALQLMNEDDNLRDAVLQRAVKTD